MRNREKTRPRLRQLPAAGAFLRKTALDGARRGRYAKNRACGASCCGGLENAAKRALQASGKFIPWQVVTISTDGRILD